MRAPPAPTVRQRDRATTAPIILHGATHLGLTVAACVADLGFHVRMTDHCHPDRIARLRRSEIPVVEPGLDDLITRGVANGHLEFVDVDDVGTDHSLAWIAHDVPIDDGDNGDPTVVAEAVALAALTLRPEGVVCVHSQVPVGSCRRFADSLPNGQQIVYFMENLQVGRSIDSFLRPDFVLFGCAEDGATSPLHEIMSLLPTEVITVRWETAELSKHALNLILATSIVIGNEIGDVAEQVGANGHLVADIVRRDARVGRRAPVRPGWGFAGGTLARDLRYLQDIGVACEIPVPLTNMVYAVNDNRLVRLAEIVARWTPENSSVGVLGASYKGGSDELRRSPGIDLVERLGAMGIDAKVWDPVAFRSADKRRRVVVDLDDVLDDAGCVVLVQQGIGKLEDVQRSVGAATSVRTIIDPWLDLSLENDERIVHVGVDPSLSRL